MHMFALEEQIRLEEQEMELNEINRACDELNLFGQTIVSSLAIAGRVGEVILDPFTVIRHNGKFKLILS